MKSIAHQLLHQCDDIRGALDDIKGRAVSCCGFTPLAPHPTYTFSDGSRLVVIEHAADDVEAWIA